MKYTGLTTNQYEEVVRISNKVNKSVEEIVDDLEDFACCYDSVEEMLKDYEKVNA